jgi:rhodanese-related sulfurtransferase
MSSLVSLARLSAPGLVALLAFAGAPADEEPKHTKDTPATVKQKLAEEKAVLIDVREKAEWDDGHLKQARLLPLSELGKKLREPAYVAGLKKTLPTDKLIYLHCKAGSRCLLAAEALRKELGPGYDFRPLKPGYADLVKAGFEKTDGQPAE